MQLPGLESGFCSGEQALPRQQSGGFALGLLRHCCCSTMQSSAPVHCFELCSAQHRQEHPVEAYAAGQCPQGSALDWRPLERTNVQTKVGQSTGRGKHGLGSL